MCRSPLYGDEVGESKIIGLELIQNMKEHLRIIRDKLLVAQSWQKSYANNHRKNLSFKEGDWIFLKLSPMRGVSNSF